MNVSYRHWLLVMPLLTAVAISSLFNLRLLSQETRMAQATSDVAFDKGDLKQSLKEAQYASLMSISDSVYSKQSTDRLEAIAVGSEATGRPRTALLAWSSLSATSVATRSAVTANSRLGQQSEQHVSYLLSKVTNRPTTEAERSEPLTSSSLRLASRWLFGAPVLVSVGLLVGVIGLLLNRRTGRATLRANIIGRGLYLVAACSWCIGWFIT
jgi:hypothetical protein